MKLDLGFVILCPNRDIKELKNTISSLSYCCKGTNALCVVDGKTTAKEIKEFKEICPTYKGKDTITSLINAGMKKSQMPWTFIVYAGSRVKTNLHQKLEQFVSSDKDILFPIMNGKMDFVDGSSNGILLATNTFKEIGEMPVTKAGYEMNDFETSKLLWACKAIEIGCQFKAIAGMRIN